MGMYGGGDGGAAEARANQQVRDAKIQVGTKQINKIFDGGNFGTGPESEWKAGVQYYTWDGTPVDVGPNSTQFNQWLAKDPERYSAVNPPAVTPGTHTRRGQTAQPQQGFGGTAPDPRIRQTYWQQYIDELTSGRKLFTGVEHRGGFDDAFYAGRKQDYINYATPQLAREYGQTSKNLGYALARSGLLNSSAAADKQGSLDLEMGRQERAIADAGQRESNQLRSDVENQRASLITQLSATGDPATANAQAMTAASGFRSPSAFTPIGNFFNDWSNIYLANQQAKAYGSPNAPAMYPVWGGAGGSSARVVK